MELYILTYVSFVILSGSCCILHFLASRTNKDGISGRNPAFIKFQHEYFLVYFFAVFADWLQGPYLYKLYSVYGFMESQIAILYVCGAAAGVLFGTVAGFLADRIGRKKLCVTFTVLYTVTCFMKLSRNYFILIVGRILGGISTSLLFCAFEAWYVHEHLERHDFPSEWLLVTISRTSWWNGVLAIAAGVTANVCAEWLSLGPVSPFMLAIPCLITAGVLIIIRWPENYGSQKVNFRKACFQGLQNIVFDKKIMYIGAIGALFESVMYMFVFLWTPILDPGNPPLGIVFASFMVCILIGSSIFQLFHAWQLPLQNILVGSILLALFAILLSVGAIHPTKMKLSSAFLSFVVYEIAIGIYFPTMGLIRNKIIPDSHRATIMNWFRVPLNILSCGGLIFLHEDVMGHGNRVIFIICTALLAVAAAAAARFLSLVFGDERLKVQTATTELI